MKISDFTPPKYFQVHDSMTGRTYSDKKHGKYIFKSKSEAVDRANKLEDSEGRLFFVYPYPLNFKN